MEPTHVCDPRLVPLRKWNDVPAVSFRIRTHLRVQGIPPSGGGVALSQLLIPLLAKSGAWACKCSVTALRTNQATETRLLSERRLSSRYSSAGRVTDRRTVEGATPVLLGWTDMTTSYYTTMVKMQSVGCPAHGPHRISLCYGSNGGTLLLLRPPLLLPRRTRPLP